MSKRLSASIRFAKWLALAIACALPLVIITGRELDESARISEAAGIVTWAVLAARFEPKFAAKRPPTWRRSLAIGFAAWAAVQGVVAYFVAGNETVLGIVGLSLYSLALVPFLFFMLIAWFAFLLAAMLFGDFVLPYQAIEWTALFVLTLLCGFPNLLAGLYATNLIELLRRPIVKLPRRCLGAGESGRS